MTYLEAQLERITSACLTVQGYNDRMDQMTGQITSVEERIVNLTRLIKLLQSSSESQEQDGQRAREDLRQALNRMAELETKCKIMVENDQAAAVVFGENKWDIEIGRGKIGTA